MTLIVFTLKFTLSDIFSFIYLKLKAVVLIFLLASPYFQRFSKITDGMYVNVSFFLLIGCVDGDEGGGYCGRSTDKQEQRRRQSRILWVHLSTSH